MFDLSFSTIIYSVITVFIALTFHEFAHGWVAYRLGDDTASLQGRLTFNPIKHLDPIGALMLIFFGFGWAKPVPVNPLRFRGNRKRGMMLVAASGPISNLILALLSAFIIRFLLSGILPMNTLFVNFFYYFMQVNVILAIFNLIPLPPLDGWRVVGGLVPAKYYFRLQQISQYSLIIIMILSFTGVLGMIIGPVANVIFSGLLAIIGL